MVNKKERDSLHIFFDKSSIPFSVSPHESDYIPNMYIMEQVVGTLVKYGKGWVYSPYLADKWENQGSKWNFHLKDNLRCENGEVINAENFVKSFRRLVKMYSLKEDIQVFKYLKYYKEFKQGSDQLGITFNNNVVTFDFQQNPGQNDLLEFLAMPYYGHYCESNFDGDRWKSPHHIVSSGLYRAEYSNGKFILKNRHDIPLNTNAPKTIYFENIDNVNTKNLPSHFISKTSKIEKITSDLHRALGTPSNMNGIVINPNGPSHLETDQRKFLSKILRRAFQLEPFDQHLFTTMIPATNFYPIPYSFDEKDIASPANLKGKEITIFNYQSTPFSEYRINIIRKALRQFDIKLKIVQLNTNDPDWWSKCLDSNDADLRPFAVNTGGSPVNWIVEMMFCTKLGVRIPDPSKRICEMVNEYKSGVISDMSDYHHKLETIIKEDAALIPVAHESELWLASKNINLKNVFPHSSTIRFDLLELE